MPKNYIWSIPEHLQSGVHPGIRVEVILGRNKRYAGIVRKVFATAPELLKPKDILNVLDDEPIIFPAQLQLWEWIAAYYMCSEGEVMQAAIPSNLKLSSESILQWNEGQSSDPALLSDNEFIVAEALEIKKELRLNEVQRLLQSTNVYPVVKKLVDKGICHVWEELKEKYKEKTENYVVLNSEYTHEEKLSALLNDWKRSQKQMELLLAYLHLLKTEGEVTQAGLLKKSNATAAQLKGLSDKNILHIEKRSVNRIRSLARTMQLSFTLSPAQQTAFDSIQTCFLTKNVCLLHGVTASGKTEIYARMIQECILQEKQVLYMLPEIALTAQIIRRLQQYFGGYIAIYHSKFNPNERVEIWNKLKSNEIKVVLGARSSLFLPFTNLGLVIIDEEQDASYKQQETAPRYHARDTAIFYATLFNAKVLLGSATPSIESYQNCIQEKYGLVQLTERYNQADLPVIETIDLTKLPVSKEKEKTALSPQLIEAIENSLSNKKQIILFQNRRGYSPYLICHTCGWIPNCQQCDVTLTYHKMKNQLACHYCGTVYPVIHTCAACGSHNLTQKNFGTEKIEELVGEQFPNAKIARMDYDSVKGKHDHDTLIKLFEQQRIDILIGTQMVVKGLDFEHVKLVGIIDADSILHFTDFRVNERAFQLMEQVSGRAGRKDGKGRVLVQISNPLHPILQFVQAHDYQKMFAYEILNRKQFQYPPYTRLIKGIFKHKETHIAEEAANIMMAGLKQSFGNEITGPAQPVISRIRNQYLWEILIKLPKDSHRVKQCKAAIKQQIIMIQSNKRYRQVGIIADVDPV